MNNGEKDLLRKLVKQEIKEGHDMKTAVASIIITKRFRRLLEMAQMPQEQMMALHNRGYMIKCCEICEEYFASRLADREKCADCQEKYNDSRTAS